MIHQTEIKFIFNQVTWGDFKQLWLIKYELGKNYNGYLEKGIIKWEEVQEGASTDGLTPFMRFGREIDIQQLVDALTEKTAIIPTKQAEVDAELKATKYHLEDLRKLVFDKPQ